MGFDISTPESAGWWLARLVARLQNDRPDIDTLEALFRGDQPLPGYESDNDQFKAFQKMARSNYLALVVEAALERMRVTGFRAGPDDKDGDKVSWELWQKARLDADQTLVHRTMLSCRRAYVIVGPHPRVKGGVLITPEHPSQVITESYPEDRREIRAALKMFTNDIDGHVHAYLYLPDAIHHFRSPNKMTDGTALGCAMKADKAFYSATSLSGWEVLPSATNPTAPVVPVVEFANRPSMLGVAVCEFEDVIDVQNRINQTLMHRLVAEKFGAFRQMAVLNLAFDEDENGDPIAPDLPSEPGVAWLLQGENLQMWQSAQTTTADIISGVEADIRDLAAITRTPPHYLLNKIVNASGTALKSAETGLVAKVREHMTQAGESWEQVIHLAHLVAGDSKPVDELEVVWADPESRSIAEISDAVQKQKAAGVPCHQLMELLGYTPSQIARMDSDRTADAMVALLAAPDIAPAAQEPGQPPTTEAPAQPDPAVAA